MRVSQRALLMVALWGLALGAMSCFSDLRSDRCSVDEECFGNERCLGGTCLPVADVSPNNGQDDVGQDAEPDVEPDVEEEAGNNGVNAKVRGTVVKASDFTPIENALVSTLPPTDSVRTNAAGEYLLDNTRFLNENFEIQVTRTGFKPATKDLIFEAGGFRNVDFIMCHMEEVACNGEDDDCDGEIDEDFKNACGGCERLIGVLYGSCGEACPSAGMIWRCDGVDALTCGASGGEICSNGADDDCDGTTDEADCLAGGG